MCGILREQGWCLIFNGVGGMDRERDCEEEKKKKTILLESRDVWIGQFSKDDKRVLNLESVVKNAKRG